MDLTYDASSELLPALVRGDLDLVVAHLPVDDPALDVLPLLAYRFRVAMRADDELATRADLRLVDLRGRRMLLAPARLQPAAMRGLRHRLEEAGITDIVNTRESDVALIANRVRASRELTLTGSRRSGPVGWVFDDPAFAVVPLAPGEVDFRLGVVWRRGAVDPAAIDHDARVAAAVGDLRPRYTD